MKFEATACVRGKEKLDLSPLSLSSCWGVWPALTSRRGNVFHVYVYICRHRCAYVDVMCAHRWRYRHMCAHNRHMHADTDIHVQRMYMQTPTCTHTQYTHMCTHKHVAQTHAQHRQARVCCMHTRAGISVHTCLQCAHMCTHACAWLTHVCAHSSHIHARADIHAHKCACVHECVCTRVQYAHVFRHV